MKLPEADQNKILALGAPVLIPILEQKRDAILSKMRGEFRSGHSEFRSTIAEYCAYCDLIQDLKIKLEIYNKE